MEFERDPYLLLILCLYIGCSIPIFNQVYSTSKIIVDEMFHIPQAQAYCAGNYTVWNPKITTLPGLYLAVKIINFFVECNTYYLRLFNLIMSVVNLGLFYNVLNFVYGLCCSQFNISLQTLTLAIFPPLYFFSHVFYTDTLSLTFLLLFTLSAVKLRNKLVVIYGVCSILTRQTNVIWIAMITLQKIFEALIISSRVYSNQYLPRYRKRGSGIAHELDPKSLKRIYNYEDFVIAINFQVSGPSNYNIYSNHHCALEWKNMFNTSIPGVLFAIFVWFNGSIVVGDKKAHTMTLNFPQLLYFLLFYGFFGLPFVLKGLRSALQFMHTNKSFVLFMTVASLIAVCLNTAVHPYLLADNRHYSFYIWNRWFGRYPGAVYIMIPLYVFLSCSLVDNLIHHNCFSFYFPYFLFLIPGLCFQRLLELRYFIVPYLIARLRFPKCSTRVVVCELLWYIAINIAFFTVFFTKEVKWNDFEEIQRIIW